MCATGRGRIDVPFRRTCHHLEQCKRSWTTPAREPLAMETSLRCRTAWNGDGSSDLESMSCSKPCPIRVERTL